MTRNINRNEFFTNKNQNNDTKVETTKTCAIKSGKELGNAYPAPPTIKRTHLPKLMINMHLQTSRDPKKDFANFGSNGPQSENLGPTLSYPGA